MVNRKLAFLAFLLHTFSVSHCNCKCFLLRICLDFFSLRGSVNFKSSILCCFYSRSSQSIKIGTDLSIDKSVKIGKSDLIDIDCIDQSVEIDNTLVSFIDLS